jgi:hypothetical protein
MEVVKVKTKLVYFHISSPKFSTMSYIEEASKYFRNCQNSSE